MTLIFLITVVSVITPPAMNKIRLKYTSLVLLTLLTAVNMPVERYSRAQEGDMYNTTTAAFMLSLIRLLACLGVIFYQEEFSIFRWIQVIITFLIKLIDRFINT